ncbi:anti-virulence regulator CigR family protein [Halomonas sp. LC1]|uniref:anti-virulence regulator CigR family protein n=1 Tax=Halomonas sp. LC1 TaxID=3043733 RepID=UPI002556B8AD|nr:anti-virulence regulator CigR family protein [Halomonas sp. LC1]MDK9687192.1 anti-virulence regulator CigR family protein [Halomonas sp. LC1]
MKPITLAVVIALLVWQPSAMAQPSHAPAHGARHHHNDSSSHQRSPHHETPRQHDERDYRSVDLPRINERELLRLLSQYEAPRAEPLPPGIQRQLERGKPLPPGIAKRFDGPIANQLPRYPGYEWERVGADVVLIEAATRVVVDVLVDALR